MRLKDSKIFELNKKTIILQALIIMLGVLVFVLAKTRYIFIFSDCMIKKNFGIPCPGCGATRCVVALCDMDFIEAFKCHPAWFMAINYMVLIEIVYLINIAFKKNFLKKLYSSMIPFYIFLALFVIQWIIRIILFKNGVELPFMYINI